MAVWVGSCREPHGAAYPEAVAGACGRLRVPDEAAGVGGSEERGWLKGCVGGHHQDSVPSIITVMREDVYSRSIPRCPS